MRILSRHSVNLSRAELQAALSVRWQTGMDPVTAFENSFAAYHEVRFALATGSGRAALYLALKHLDLPPGSAVAIPAYTFFTLPAVVEALGLKPLFVPCDVSTFAIAPDRLDSALTEEVSALIALHPFGQTAPMKPIMALCEARGIPVVEDPSQSIGARYRSVPVGAVSRAGAFSLVSGKNMTACGGGMLITNDETLAEKARADLENAPFAANARKSVLETSLRWALSTRPGFAAGLFPPFLVLNTLNRQRLDDLFHEAPSPFDPSRSLTRLTPLQAAIGRVQLQRLDSMNAIRRANAMTLIEGLKEVPHLRLPRLVGGCDPTYNAVAIRVPHATDFRKALLNRGIDSRADYMRLHEHGQPIQEEVVYLPNHPGLGQKDMRYIVDAVTKIMD